MVLDFSDVMSHIRAVAFVVKDRRESIPIRQRAFFIHGRTLCGAIPIAITSTETRAHISGQIQRVWDLNCLINLALASKLKIVHEPKQLNSQYLHRYTIASREGSDSIQTGAGSVRIIAKVVVMSCFGVAFLNLSALNLE